MKPFTKKNKFSFDLPSRWNVLIFIIPILSSSIHSHSHSYSLGEVLRYRIRWGAMTIGYSSLSVTRKVIIKNHECIVFESRARSTAFVSAFFPIKDDITSCWDPVTKIPLLTEKNLNEGDYHRYYRAEFDPERKNATWSERQFKGNTNEKGVKNKNAKWISNEGITSSLPAGFQDILSAIYFTRSYQSTVIPGSSFQIPLFDDLQLGVLKMEILNKTSITLTLKEGKKNFPSFMVKPWFKTTGMFKTSQDLQIWISDDDNRLPLLIKTKIPYVGNVTVELIDIKK